MEKNINISFNERDFVNRLLSIENKFEKKGPLLLRINDLEDYNKYFGDLYRDLNYLGEIFNCCQISSSSRELLEYYLTIYFGYLEIVACITEYKLLYSHNASFAVCDNRLSSLYTRIINLMGNGPVVAPKFFQVLTTLLENMTERYFGGRELYQETPIYGYATISKETQGQCVKRKVHQLITTKRVSEMQ